MLLKVRKRHPRLKKFIPNLHKLVYKNSFFYSLSKIDNKLIANTSLVKLLDSNYFSYSSNSTSKNLVLRSRIINLEGGDLGFDLGSKFVIIKPMAFYPSFVYKQGSEVLVHNISFLISFLAHTQVDFFFKATMFKKVLISFPASFFTATKKILRLRFLVKRQFFFKLFKLKLSVAQKKVNFLKFNIFFKNININ